MLDLRRLDILVRFAAHHSITATAEDLGYSPSAISQQLATLEREAGVALLERTAHSAVLTDAGRELAEHAVAILDAVETARGSVRARAGSVSGRVTVSCIPGLAVRIAPELAALQERHPELVVIARETGSVGAATDILGRACDIAVIDDWNRSPASTSGLTSIRLHHEHVVLAVPAGHPATRLPEPVSAVALRRTVEPATWLSAPAGHLSRNAGDQRLTAVAATPARRWEFEGLHVMAALVGTGAGIAFLPESIATAEAGVVGLRITPRMDRHLVGLTRRNTSHNPAIAACLTAIRNALAPPDTSE
ncbi:DNA-binding transcriptional regulator, LysR family [Amycolatopsis marina]|uniref:DNA-binding transcriptional regulator, LysR family n=1 Tax=Amycolatopsis marina TaxID=490629 RepID=A0A1I1C4U4_9PSEU|nr:LysR family transcriptional regulator [Amycolatopsis marina]SFB55810.1 DNA-binding transcriptional regulator, LysR family [Amycolatopsis marina]